MFIVEQKKQVRILQYGFTIEPNWSVGEKREDVIPIILEWVFENIGKYDHERWQIRHGMGDKKFLSLYFSKLEDAMAFKVAWS